MFLRPLLPGGHRKTSAQSWHTGGTLSLQKCLDGDTLMTEVGLLVAIVTHDELVILGRLAGAILIGAMIGLERSFHGRPAGFGTHALVCLASALLMCVTVYQMHWMTEVPIDTIRADPTGMAQGIMTGIGFLGAGVIFKEGLTVRGLTTAASIWVTAALGILVGIGFWYPAVLGAVGVLLVLALFRLIERRLPSEFYAHHILRFARDRVMGGAEVQTMIRAHGFTIANLSSRLTEGGQQFEYRMTIKSRDRKNAEKLSNHLRGLPEVVELLRQRGIDSRNRKPFDRQVCPLLAHSGHP